ncbi:MAG: serine hydrolase, partial [Rubritepida sp.]|nr:serine hydrolase [Rubritepida sp.]
GLLVAADGMWNGREIISKSWLDLCRTPCALNPQYGFLFWLNTGRAKWPSASEGTVCFSGAGGNTTWMESSEGIVAVTRWLDGTKLDAFMRQVRAAVTA